MSGVFVVTYCSRCEEVLEDPQRPGLLPPKVALPFPVRYLLLGTRSVRRRRGRDIGHRVD